MTNRWQVRKEGSHWQVTSPEGVSWGGYILFAIAIREATYLARKQRRHPGVFR